MKRPVPTTTFKSFYNFSELERAIGYKFKNQSLLRQALTHSSARSSRSQNYERMEFIGDATIGLYVRLLLKNHFLKSGEGDLARKYNSLVQNTFIAEIARKINLGKHIIMSQSEIRTGGRDKFNILADVMEAIIGAVADDATIPRAGKVVAKLWSPYIPTAHTLDRDYKSRVQEIVQARRLPSPTYVLLHRKGPDHAPEFHVELRAQGFKPVLGKGSSKKSAEQDAAKNFLAVHNK